MDMDGIQGNNIEVTNKIILNKLFNEGVRKRFLDLFGKLYCQFDEKANALIGNEIEGNCNHPAYTTSNDNHYELLIYVKNILKWLDSNVDNTNCVKTSYIHVEGEKSEFKLNIVPKLKTDFVNQEHDNILNNSNGTSKNTDALKNYSNNVSYEVSISTIIQDNINDEKEHLEIIEINSSEEDDKEKMNSVQTNRDKNDDENSFLNAGTSVEVGNLIISRNEKSKKILASDKKNLTKKRSKSDSLFEKKKKLESPSVNESIQSNSICDTKKVNPVQMNEDKIKDEYNFLNVETFVEVENPIISLIKKSNKILESDKNSKVHLQNTLTKKRSKSVSLAEKKKKLESPSANDSVQSNSIYDTDDSLGSDINVTSELGKSPLHNSVMKINPDHTNDSKDKVLKKALIRNCKGETQLHLHCAKGTLFDVQSLLNCGINPNVIDNAGWTPLHEAVKRGSVQIVELLIKCGALVNVPGFEYETPLFIAIKYGHFDVAKLLLQNGADSKCINIYGIDAQSLNVEMWSKLSKFEIPTSTTNLQINLPYASVESGICCIFLTSISAVNLITVNKFSAIFKAKIITKNNFKKYLKQITHIIVSVNTNNTCEINYEILMGLANGVCILNANWINDSLKDGLNMLKPISDYEVKGVMPYVNCDGPRMARLNKQNLIPKLFDGIDIHITGSSAWNNLSTIQFKDIVLEFGAKLLKRMPNPEDCPTNIIPYHCRGSEQMRYVSTIVLYTNDTKRLIKYNMNHIKVFPISWFIEAVQKYRIV